MTTSLPLDIPVLLGSSRIGRQSVKVGRCVLARLAAKDAVSTTLLDLAEYDFAPMALQLDQMDDPPSGLAEFADRLRRADAVAMVVPEYKNGYPGVLKNAFDYLEAGILDRKPIGICTVSSGAFGGVNCLAQLRLVCLAMGGLPIPRKCLVGNAQEAFDDDGTPRDEDVASRIDALVDDLTWYADALRAAARG